MSSSNASSSQFPNPQGLHSKTWTAPDLSGSSTLGEIFQHHATYSSSHLRVVWEDQDAPGDVKRSGLTYANWWRGLQRAAKFVIGRFGLQPGASEPIAIGIFATIDTVTYAALVEAIVLLGHTAFPISSRNSVAAVVHLLNQTKCSHLLFCGGEPIVAVVNAVSKEMNGKASDGKAVQVREAPSFEMLFPMYGPSGKDDGETNVAPLRKSSAKEPAIILHSSGSTSFPKPIKLSHEGCVQSLMTLIWYGEGEVCGRVYGAFSLPQFHLMGLFGMICGPHGSGFIPSLFKPGGPPPTISPEAVLRGLKATRSDIVLAVPSFYETWAEDEETMKYLATLASAMYGGGPLAEYAGKALVSRGVKLTSHYGATEIGIITYGGIFKEYSGCFDWMTFSKMSSRRLIPQEPLGGEKGTYELVIVANDHYKPAVSTIDGEHAFETRDLIILHPDNDNLFKIIGRVDDQLMLSTGEKTNPGPIENILVSSPLIQQAVMFGRGRNQNGVILKPSEGHEIDPNDEKQLSEFRSAVWDKMILVTAPGKPLPLTPKGTVMRKGALVLYEPEIEACYTAVEHASNLVRKVLERENIPADEDDLFQNGLDSLRATYLRNSLTAALRTAQNPKGARLPSNFVFQHPTIASISQTISSLASSLSGETEAMPEESIVSHVQEMEAAVKKYTANLPVHKPDDAYPAPKSDEEVVVLTGSTGGLGAHFLAELINMPSVVKVYALNRRSRTSLLERQTSVLVERLGDKAKAAEVMKSPKLHLVEATLEQDDLGISSELLEELDSVATLVRLALRSPYRTPPRILSTSSISTVSNWSSPQLVPEEAVDLRCAAGLGYGESKAVAGKVLEIVAAQTPVKSTVFRIGQLSGSSQSGAWATSDWVPLIVKGSQVIGAIPDGKGPIAWLAMDEAASAILDLRHSSSPVHNIVHPYPTEWSSVMRSISSFLNLPVIPFGEWVGKLDSTAEDPKALESNPALALLDFYKRMSLSFESPAADGVQREAGGLPRLDVTKSTRESRSLREAPVTTKEDVGRWIAYWKTRGFIDGTTPPLAVAVPFPLLSHVFRFIPSLLAILTSGIIGLYRRVSFSNKSRSL
ncbi:hypothetical protein FRB98_000364 [Tulasnella sp. 332]|nr:hypothetical protein FRB98_000364 [Tulasnella sp. 332]